MLGGSGRFLGLVLVGCVGFCTVMCVGCSGVGMLMEVFAVSVGVSVVDCHGRWKQCVHAVSSAMMRALLKHVCECDL